MRRLKTYPALASVNLPASADVLGVHDRGPEQAPSLVVSYDDADEHKVERRYVVLQSGDAIPPGAQFVDSWRRSGCGPQMSGIFCLFELVDDMPGDLPADVYPHWRVLQSAGPAPAAPALGWRRPTYRQGTFRPSRLSPLRPCKSTGTGRS